ncbi:MAG: hypothetical protein J5545_06510 [Bacteroidaceae bacterium]|nr:hypothetical protein [Bacteroidaceae bacterium]
MKKYIVPALKREYALGETSILGGSLIIDGDKEVDDGWVKEKADWDIFSDDAE